MTPDNHEELRRVHYLRLKAHWGKKWADENAFSPDRWPEDRAAWAAVAHNKHPADANVEMARFHLKLAREIMKGTNDEG